VIRWFRSLWSAIGNVLSLSLTGGSAVSTRQSSRAERRTA
jgi:hypothetical protein